MKLALLPLGFLVASLAFGETNLPLSKPSPAVKKVEGKAPPGAEAASAPHDEEGEGGEAVKPYVASVETYGSSRINSVILKKTLGKELDEWVEKGLKGDAASIEMEQRLAKKVQDQFGFAFADWSIVQYFEPGDMAIHITLDVVEKQDVARRMPFMERPAQTLTDPDNLIQQWIGYEDEALRLVESGILEPESASCPAFHCPFGHTHPKLKKYEKIFVDGVKKRFKELSEIQEKDGRVEWRAAATYLLAYHKEGKEVVARMLSRVRDPEPLVRNNALRVLGDIAEYHAELPIALPPIVQALEFPRVSDRSKSLYVVYLQTMHSPKARDEVMKAIPTLVDLLQSKQPDHKELSHGILRKVSGKDYAAEDIQSWKNWSAKAVKDIAKK
jgi:hypothetical protein